MAKRGLKPGQTNAGSFKPGYDYRRNLPRSRFVPGTDKTVAEHCQLKTLEALEVIYGLLMDKNAPHDVRRKCADSLLDRGWGKPEQAFKVEDSRGETDLAKLSTSDLMAMLLEKQEQERQRDRTIEGRLEDQSEPGQEQESKDKSNGAG